MPIPIFNLKYIHGKFSGVKMKILLATTKRKIMR
jgi:hypothetical protein